MKKAIVKQRLNHAYAGINLALRGFGILVEALEPLRKEFMDKKIKKVKKVMDKKMDALVAEDKPRDKKLKKCAKVMKSKKKASKTTASI